MRKRIFIIICMLMLSLTSCSLFGGDATPQATAVVKAPLNKQVFTDPMTGISDITTFDPALAFDAQSITAIQMVFTGLVQLNDQEQVVAGLAQTWSVSSDGLSWTFRLKQHLKFSDGTPLTSVDVAYSIDRALQPTTRSMVAPIYLSLILDSDKLLAGSISTLINDSLLTPDSHTIIIKTRVKSAYFLSMLTHPCSYVVEKKLIELYGTHFTDHLIDGGGAGPFRVSSYIHRKEIDFAPNHFYYDTPPQLEKVVFPFYPQDAAAYNAYQKGAVDATGVPISTLANDMKRPDFHQAPQLWIDYYSMNYLVKPFDNIQIRQAFALAIDKTAIASAVWHGTVIPTNHIVPLGMDGYNPHLTGPDGTQNLNGNSALAKTLLMKGLQAEGWSSVSQMPPIKLTYASGVSDFSQEVASMVDMWKKALGVSVTAVAVDYNTLLADVTAATDNPRGIQMWGLVWVAEYPDPQDFLTRQFDTGTPNNNMNYGQNASNDATQQQNTQQLLERADANFQAQARLQAYQKAEQQLVNDVAWLPVEQVTQVYLLKPYVIGMANNAQGLIPPDDWARIYIAQH